jgi:hypothetical protein
LVIPLAQIGKLNCVLKANIRAFLHDIAGQLFINVGARRRLRVVLRQNIFYRVNSTLIIMSLSLKHKVVAWVFAGKFLKH